jgi:hypothetical protein
MADGAFDEPFEHPFVMRRNTPDTAVTATRPAPNSIFSFEREVLELCDFLGSCELLLK